MIEEEEKNHWPWNKNKKGCFSEETIEKFKVSRKGRRFSPLKITDEQCKEIITQYNKKQKIKEAGTKSKNGKIISYETAFSKTFSVKYNVTAKQIYNIITGKRNVL